MLCPCFPVICSAPWEPDLRIQGEFGEDREIQLASSDKIRILPPILFTFGHPIGNPAPLARRHPMAVNPSSAGI